jgi:hypothetical protein
MIDIRRQMNTKENISLIKSMDMESSTGLQAVFTRETTGMMRERVLERCIGLMGANTLVIGKRGYKMDMER